MKTIIYNDKRYYYFEKSVCVGASEYDYSDTTIIKYEIEEHIKQLPDNTNIILKDQTFGRKSIIVMYDDCKIFNQYKNYEFTYLEFTYQTAVDITKEFIRKEKIKNILNE